MCVYPQYAYPDQHRAGVSHGSAGTDSAGEGEEVPPALTAVANHQQTNNFSNGWLLFIATHYALRSKLRTEYNRGVPRGASAPRLQFRFTCRPLRQALIAPGRADQHH